jgi:two-component system NtrC family sensor kinase
MDTAIAVAIPLIALIWLAFFALVTSRKDVSSPARRAFLLYLLAQVLLTAGALTAWLLAVASPPWTPLVALLAGLAMPLGAYVFTRAYAAWRLPRLAYGAMLAALVTLGLAQYVVLVRVPALVTSGDMAPSVLALLGVLYSLSLLGLGAWLWVHAWRVAPGGERRFLRMVLLGLAVLVSTMSLYFSSEQRYGLELVLAGISVTLAALVVFRRRLPPLPLPQRRSAGYSLLSLMGVVLAALLAYGAHSLAGLASVFLILTAGLMLCGVTLAFPEVIDGLGNWVERATLRSQYAARRMIEELAEAAPAVLDLEPLVAMILERTMRALNIRWGLFALCDRTSQELLTVAARGPREDYVGVTWPRDHPLTRWLLDGSPDSRADGLPDSQAPATLPALDTAWMVPVRLRDEAVGVFLYGPHTSGAGYSTTECSILDLLANEISAAVANARLFNQVAQARREWLQTFDALSDGVFLHDRQGRILRANRAFARLVGRSFEHINAHHWYELMPAGEEPRQVCSPQQRGAGEHQVSEYDLSFEDRRTLHVTVSPLAEGDDFCVHVVRDVTEERALQQQLAQAEKLAAIGEMLSGVAHELNNPLTTIIGFSELLQDAEVADQVRTDLRRIYRQAKHCSHIVQSLLTFARQSRIQLAEVEVDTLLRQTLEFLQPRLQSCHVQAHLELAGSLPHILADAGQLQQVFLNLCSNALQAMSEARDGGNLYLRSEATPTHVRITVGDDGPGIPRELMGKVFDPFFTTKSVGEGTGLGLSICYGIVREHGGRIWAESEPGHGATFYVELPIRHGTVAPAPPSPSPSLRGRRILVVEDEEAIVALCRRVLRQAGAEMLAARDGLQGLEVLAKALDRDEAPDLLVVDLRMPRLDGPSFYEQVRRDHGALSCRFLFISGDTIRSETQRFLDDCGLPCLRKPFGTREFEQAVGAALGRDA